VTGKRVTEKILIVGPAWIGDMVMAQSLFITLKECFPSSTIDVVAPIWSSPVLSRMPEVNNSIHFDVAHKKFSLRKRVKTGINLRGNQYTRAIIIPRSFKSAIVPYMAKIPVRTGYRGEMRYGLLNDIRKLNKDILTQTVQRQVALGLPVDATLPPDIPYPVLDIDKQNQKNLLSTLALNTDKLIIGLIPGAEYGPAKQWSVESYAQLTGQLIATGYQVWIFGSEKDRNLGNAITKINKNAKNLCGKTSLTDVIDLIDLCQTIITNDSGLMHVAAATGKNLITIYGSSTPVYTPPLTNHAAILYQGLDCSPCFKRECPLGHTNCLNFISVDDVMGKLIKNV
jgi:heptosyltransferase-2